MSVDTALKKKAATCFLIPHVSGVYPQALAGIGQALRMAATWVYPVMTTDGSATTDYTSAKPGTAFTGAGANTKYSSGKVTVTFS